MCNGNILGKPPNQQLYKRVDLKKAKQTTKKGSEKTPILRLSFKKILLFLTQNHSNKKY